MINLINMLNSCKHENIPNNVKKSYCPDCGAYVEIKYYIVRCSCCNIKRKGTLIGENIFPINLFCHNCGGHSFYLEEVEKINAFNLDYIVLKKEVITIKARQKNTCQIWVETPPKREIKLLTTTAN